LKTNKQSLHWILQTNIKIVLFCNLVECDLNASQGVKRVVNLSMHAINHARRNHIDLTCAFAKMMDARVNVTTWWQQVFRRT
jgi:hypothetical protein